MTVFILCSILAFWLISNVIVLIKWKPQEMWEELVTEQDTVGKIFGNLYYLPYWLIHLIIGLIRYYVIRPIIKFVKFCYFAVARFIQQIYHSIFDIL